MRGFTDNLQAIFGSFTAEGFRKMLNRPLSSVTTANDKESITFAFTDGGSPVRFVTEGDCCSRSWIEHFEAPSSLTGRSIVDGEEAPMQELPEQDYDCIKVYKTSFILDNGERITVEYRNSSNGYYGGSLAWDGQE